MKTNVQLAERRSPASVRAGLVHAIGKFYALPPAFVSFVFFSSSFVGYCLLPRWIGVPILLSIAPLPLYEDLLRRLPGRQGGTSDPEDRKTRALGDRDGRPIGSALDVRQLILLALGLVLAVVVLPPLHLGLLLANGLFAYWLGTRAWDWVRKYWFFFVAESFYLFLKYQFPRPGSGQNGLFSHVVPQGAYFAFLWCGVEVIVFLKLLDFVLWKKDDVARHNYSPIKFVFYLLFPFSFFTGPAIGFADLFACYKKGGPGLGDLAYAVRKVVGGALALFVVAVWLSRQVLWLRAAVVDRAPIIEVIDSRLLMWAWIAGLSILLQLIYQGYIDMMLGLARISGFTFPEQFRLNLLAKDPVEYWQNGNRSIYKITNYHVFSRFFDRRKIVLKSMYSTTASGVFHAFLCPAISLGQGLLLGGLFAINGLIVALTIHARKTRAAAWVDTWASEGPPHNALILFGVASTFTLLCFTRSAFLLMVEGVSVGEWWGLMRLLFIRAN